jgi:hypothetical protein
MLLWGIAGREVSLTLKVSKRKRVDSLLPRAKRRERSRKLLPKAESILELRPRTERVTDAAQ